MKQTNVRADIGIDELQHDIYRCVVISEEMENLAHVFGRTPEECENNADILAAAFEMKSALELILPNLQALVQERFGEYNLKRYEPLIKGRAALERAINAGAEG